MADKTIDDYSDAGGIDASADYLLIQQASTNTYRKINRNTLLGTAGTPVTTTGIQSLQNKTLDNTNTITVLDTNLTLQDNSDTTKQIRFNAQDISAATTRTFRFPDISDILVTESATQGLTNKNIVGPTISGGSITNSTVSVDSIAEYTAANGVTVDGLNIKDGKLNTNNSVVTANVTDTAITPAKLQAGTGSTWVLSTWSPTWTNLTVGNGTQVAKYIQTGKWVSGYIHLLFGTTTSVSGTITVNLPVAAATNYDAPGGSLAPSGVLRLTDSGTGAYNGLFFIDGTTIGTPTVLNVSGTYATDNSLTATVPFTFTTNDAIFIWFGYEGA